MIIIIIMIILILGHNARGPKQGRRFLPPACQSTLQPPCNQTYHDPDDNHDDDEEDDADDADDHADDDEFVVHY